MLEHITIGNYRSLAEVSVGFDQLTVLVGPNGSGKSNLIDAIRFVSEAVQRGLDAAVIRRHGFRALSRWNGASRPYDVRISFECAIERLFFVYVLNLGRGKFGDYEVKLESCSLKESRDSRQVAGYEAADGQWLVPPFESPPALGPVTLILPLLSGLEPYSLLYQELVGMSFYNISPHTVAEPQGPGRPYPLQERGENLASVLRELRSSKRRAALELQQALQRITGDVEGYLVRRVGGYLVTSLIHTDGNGRDPGRPGLRPRFELSQESDGTLRLLGILAALYQEPPRTLIGLEEPELTIHPGAMSLLWEEIKDASRRSQIILTTHSPDLLDMCTAEQLRIVEKVHGITKVGPMAEEQKQMIRKRLVAPGQLLQAQGLERAEEGQ